MSHTYKDQNLAFTTTVFVHELYQSESLISFCIYCLFIGVSNPLGSCVVVLPLVVAIPVSWRVGSGSRSVMPARGRSPMVGRRGTAAVMAGGTVTAIVTSVIISLVSTIVTSAAASAIVAAAPASTASVGAVSGPSHVYSGGGSVRSFRDRVVDSDATAVDLLISHRGFGGLSILLRFEGDEGESPGSSSLIVQNNQHLLEGTETRKFLLQFPFSGVQAQTEDADAV